MAQGRVILNIVALVRHHPYALTVPSSLSFLIDATWSSSAVINIFA
jgi:hypothetical protein